MKYSWLPSLLASKPSSFLYDKYENHILMSNFFSIPLKSRLTLVWLWGMVPAKQIERSWFFERLLGR
jgi:hypothetical protein